jgi:hypothetical protein
VSEHPVPGARDDTDAVQDIARDLAEVAAQISTFKGEATAYLGEPTYNALRLRLEMAYAAVEAATVEARRRRSPGPLRRALRRAQSACRGGGGCSVADRLEAIEVGGVKVEHLSHNCATGN